MELPAGHVGLYRRGIYSQGENSISVPQVQILVALLHHISYDSCGEIVASIARPGVLWYGTCI